MGVNAAIDAAAIDVLFEKVNALEARVEALEAKQSPVIDYGAPHNTNEECQAHTCSYYDHYLSYGPADLIHEGYHAAERAFDAHLKYCRTVDRDTLCQTCIDFEKRVRA